MKKHGVPQNVEIVHFFERAAQHIFCARNYLFANSPDKNLLIYELQQEEILARFSNKDFNLVGKLKVNAKSSELVTRLQDEAKYVDIHEKEMTCSLVRKESVIIGCKDGTLVEMSLDSLEFTREMKTHFAIQAIAEINNDFLALGQNAGTGWAGSSGKISIIGISDISKLKAKNVELDMEDQV